MQYSPDEPRVRCIGSRISLRDGNITDWSIINTDSGISVMIRDYIYGLPMDRDFAIDVRAKNIIF